MAALPRGLHVHVNSDLNAAPQKNREPHRKPSRKNESNGSVYSQCRDVVKYLVYILIGESSQGGTACNHAD